MCMQQYRAAEISSSIKFQNRRAAMTLMPPGHARYLPSHRRRTRLRVNSPRSSNCSSNNGVAIGKNHIFPSCPCWVRYLYSQPSLVSAPHLPAAFSAAYTVALSPRLSTGFDPGRGPPPLTLRCYSRTHLYSLRESSETIMTERIPVITSQVGDCVYTCLQYKLERVN